MSREAPHPSIKSYLQRAYSRRLIHRHQRLTINSSVDFHEGVGAELVSDPLPDSMAFDDVARLDVVGKDHGVIPHGTAGLLDRRHRPHPVALARPEREPRSVGTVEEVAVLDPDRDLDLLPSALAPGLRHPVSLSAGLLQP